MNNFTIVYENMIAADTPRKSDSGSHLPTSRRSKDIMGDMFSWRKVEKKIKMPYDRV